MLHVRTPDVTRADAGCYACGRRMLCVRTPDVTHADAGCYACGRRMLRMRMPDVTLQAPKMLPEEPWTSYDKNKTIGNISESSLIDDRGIINSG